MERHNGKSNDGLPIQFFEDGEDKAKKEEARRFRTTWEYLVQYFPLLKDLSHGKKVFDTRDPSDSRSCFGSTGSVVAEWTVSVPCVIGYMNHTRAWVEIYVHDDGSFSWRPGLGDMKGDVGTCESESVLKGLREDGFGDSVIANLGIAHARDCIYGFLGLVDTDGWTAEEVGLGLKDMMGNIGVVEDDEESAGDKFVETAGVPVEASPSEPANYQSEGQSEQCAPDTNMASGKREREKDYARIVAEADRVIAAGGLAYCAVKVLTRRGSRPGDVTVTVAMSETPEGAAKWCIGSYNSFNNSHAPSFEEGPYFPAMDRQDGETVSRVMLGGIDCTGAEYLERWGYTARWSIVALRGWKRCGEQTA